MRLLSASIFVTALFAVTVIHAASPPTCFPTSPYGGVLATLFMGVSSRVPCYTILPGSVAQLQAEMGTFDNSVCMSPSLPTAIPMSTAGDIFASTQGAALATFVAAGLSPNQPLYPLDDDLCHIGGFSYEPTTATVDVCPNLSDKPNCVVTPAGNLNAVLTSQMCALQAAVMSWGYSANSTCVTMFRKMLCSIVDVVMTGTSTRAFPVVTAGHSLVVYEYSVCRTMVTALEGANCKRISETLPKPTYCDPSNARTSCYANSIQKSLNEAQGYCVRGDASTAANEAVCLPTCIKAPSFMQCACETVGYPPPPPTVPAPPAPPSDDHPVVPLVDNKHGSTAGHGGTVAAIVFGVLFTALAVYCVVGTGYNRFMLRKRGLEQIPNYDMWAALVALARPAVGRRPKNVFAGLDESDDELAIDADVQPVFGGAGGAARFPRLAAMQRGDDGDDDDLETTPL